MGILIGYMHAFGYLAFGKQAPNFFINLAPSPFAKCDVSSIPKRTDKVIKLRILMKCIWKSGVVQATFNC